MSDLQDIRCSKCQKLLAEAKIEEGKLAIKCKCGTMNTIEVRQVNNKPFVYNQPYQNRLNLVQK